MFPITKRILLCCYEVPRYGGASTGTYELFRTWQKAGLDVSLVNLIQGFHLRFYRNTFGEGFANPEDLANVHCLVIRKPFSAASPELARLIERIGPDVALCKGPIATIAVERAAPGLPLVFLTSDCAQARLAVEKRAQQACTLRQNLGQWAVQPPLLHPDEEEAVELADLIVAHSDQTLEFFRLFYPSLAAKIYGKAIWGEWIYRAAQVHEQRKKPFIERNIDVLFIASDWSRPAKNLPMVLKIARGLQDLRIHLVGLTDRPLEGLTCHGLVKSQDELFTLMGDAKTIVSPSVIDAAPGILFEASAMDCNVVASRNCGNWTLCHEDLLVRSFSARAFIQRIRRSTENRYPDHMADFATTNAAEALLEVLANL